VRGTEFIVANEKNEERVATLEGLVRVSGVKSSGEFWDVSAGHVLVIIPNEMPKVRETRPALAEQWKKETTF
jgi:ferric-dicitrate binding protein FerR (iron transport regulator)